MDRSFDCSVGYSHPLRLFQTVKDKKMPRTPGPIRWEDEHASGLIIDSVGDTMAYVDCLSDDNAAHIVRTWNNFDSLLAACEAVRKLKRQGGCESEVMEQVESAIAKAKG